MTTRDEHLLEALRTRRSVPAIRLGEPGPSRGEIEDMLTIAARVPDHGKLAPWRFVVLSGAARERIGEDLEAIAVRANPDLSERERDEERQRLSRAPVVIVVVSLADPAHPKIPEWEQVLSSGIACYNLLLAAGAYGYGANWLTEWPAYDAEAQKSLGLRDGERISGFLHVGTADFSPPDRPRPNLADIVTWME